MLIGFKSNSRGRTCAHTVSHPMAVMCHADVNLSGSAGVQMLDFRGFSTPCYEAYPGCKRNGGPIVLPWKRIWHDVSQPLQTRFDFSPHFFWPDSDLRPLPGLLGLAFGQTRIFSSLQFPLPS